MESVRFPSQTTYPNGSLACTSIAWHWAVACLKKMVEPLITAQQAEIIFTKGIQAYTLICQKFHQQHKLLSNFELEAYFSHRKLKSAEFNVVDDSIEVDSEMRLFWIPFTTFKRLLLHSPAENYAMILTCNNHTHALFSNENSITWFDSMAGECKSFNRHARDFNKVLSEAVSVYAHGEIAVTLLKT